MKFDSFIDLKAFILILLILFGAVVWFFNFSIFSRDKEEIIIQVAEIAEKIAFPYRLAKLRSLPADTSLLLPVSGVELEDVADTWGAARSGGREHEGVDIFAERGTPVFAATPGYVWRTGNGTLGGNFVFVIGAGGVRYYYAHLDSVAEGIDFGEPVTTDTVLGYVGNTGNASGTPPHLHFGMYFQGPKNPYELLVDR